MSNKNYIEEIVDKIEYINLLGTVYIDAKSFDYKDYFDKENMFHYRLSKLIFYLGKKDNKDIIIGLQQIFKNYYGKEIEDKKIIFDEDNIVDIKKLEINSNDYLCNCHIRIGEDRVTQIRLKTKKGNELIIGSEDGDDLKLNKINDNNNYMILYFFGNYRKYLEAIGINFIPIKTYLEPFLGFFELRKKYKNDLFRKKIDNQVNNFEYPDKVLWKICSLPENCFNSIIKFCLF